MQDLNHIQHDAVALYIKGLEAKGYSKQEIAAKLRNVGHFMQWAYDKDHLQYQRYQHLKDEIAKYLLRYASSADIRSSEDHSEALSSDWASPIKGRAPPQETDSSYPDGHIVDVSRDNQNTTNPPHETYGTKYALLSFLTKIPVIRSLPYLRSQRAQMPLGSHERPILGPVSTWPQQKDSDTDSETAGVGGIGAFNFRHPAFLLGTAMTLLVFGILTAGIYDRFFREAQSSFAYPSTPTSPTTRFLSFQGRLTDSLGNPITAATDMRFRLYDASSGGTTLYDSGTCSISPDSDGIHNVLIGSDCGSGIASSVFTENAEVWLGVTVGTDSEMTPRQQIANVPYALNAETLQGLPLGTEVSTVPYIDQGGDLLIGAASPQIGSTYESQTFLLSSANALTIQSAGTGDITLVATGSGELIMQANGDTDDYIYLTTSGDDAQLLFEGYTANDPGVRLNSATNQLEYRDENESGWTTLDSSSTNYWQLNSSVLAPGGDASVGDALVLGGNTTTNHQFDVTGAVTGKALVLFDETGDQNILTASTSGTTRLNLTNAGQLELKADGSSAGITIGAGDDISFYHDGTDSILTTSTGDWNFTAADDFIFTDNQVTNIQLSDVDTSLPNSNTGIVDAINDAYNAATGGGGGLWTDSATTTYLTTTTDDLVLGGSSPLSSAKLSIDGDADQIQLIVQGNGTQTNSLAVFENSTGTDVFTISNAGNIVIAGTTDAQGTIANSTGNVVVADTIDLGSSSTGLRVDTSGVVLDIDGNIVLNDQVDIGSATTGVRVATTGSISDIDGNLVLADTVDLGSSTTGVRIATTGSINDIDGNLVLNDQTDIGSATTGIRVTTAGAISDIDGNLVLNDQTDIGSATTGIRVTTAGAISDIDGNLSLADNTDITGNLTNTGNTTFGDAGADTVLSNAAAWTFANDTAVTLSGGVNGLNFDSNTLSIDAANDRIGIGTAAPDAAWIDIAAATTSKAQLNLTTSSGTNVSSPNSGDLWWNGTELYFYNGSSNTNLLDSGSGGAWSDLTDPAADLTLAMSDYATTFNWDTAINDSYFALNIDNNGGTAGNDYLFSLVNAVSTQTTGDLNTEALLLLDQADTTASGTTALDNALLITNSGGSTLTDGIHIGTGSQAITNAINIGSTGVTTDIVLQNGETIDNDTDGTITMTGAIAVTGTSDLQGNVANSTGNLVLADTVDLGSASTGINITTAGLITDTDGNVVIGDEVDLGSASTGINITTAGAISDSDGNVAINDTVDVTGNITATGDLAVNGDDITSDGNLTLNATGYTRIGDTATPGSANGDDDLFVEGDIELDGVLYLDGTLDTTFTAGSIVFAGASGVLAEDNTNFFWDDTNNKLGIGDNTPDGKLEISGAITGKALAIFNETGDQAILTASASGTERFTVENNGNVSFNPSAFGSAITLYDVDTTLPNSNTGIVDAINDAYDAAIGGGGGLWSDSGTTTYLTTTTDDLVLGGSSPLSSAKFSIDGDADQIQLIVQGNGTQTNFLGVFENSGGTDVFTIANSGDLVSAGDLAINGGDITSTQSTFNLLNTTPTTINFGGAATTLELGATSGTTSVNNALAIDGNTTLGNASGDSVTSNAATWTFANDTAIALSGGVDGLNFDSDTLSIDATGNKIGIGTAAPVGKLHATGAVTGKALAIFNETGDQDIFTASASGTTRFRIANDGAVYGGYWSDISNTTYGIDPAGTTNFGGNSLRITGGALLAEDSGSVAIGASSASSLLDVGGGSASFIDGTNDLLVADDAEINGTLYASTIDPNFTEGAVVFINASGALAQDSSNFFWDDTGNELGIGTNGPDATLDVLDTSGPQLRLSYTDGSVYTDFTTSSGGDLTIAPSGSDTAITGTLDVSSTFAATASDNFFVNSEGHVEVENPASVFTDGNWDSFIGSGSNAGIKLVNTDASSSTEGGGFITYSYDGAALASGDRLGFNLFGGGTGSGTVAHGGGIAGYADGTWSASSAPTRLEFEVAPSGSTSRVTALTIKEDGDVGIGTTGPDAQLDLLTTTGEQLRLTYTDGSVYSGFTVGSDGDLVIDSTGGQLELANGDTLNIGGITNTGYNAISDSGTTSNGLASDDDLYVEGDFEVDGTLYADGNIDTSFTQGSIVFAGASGVLSQDNTNFFWDDSSDELGIGTNTPSADLDIGGGSASFIDGIGDILVADDVEIDDDLFVNDDLTVSGGTITLGAPTNIDVSSSLTFESDLLALDTTTDSLDITTAATTADVLDLTADSLTTAYGLDLSFDGLTTGTGLYLASTSTSLGATTAGGSLGYFDWSPGSSTTAATDLFTINIGSNGNVDNLLNITDAGSSVFRVSESVVESSVPASFTSAGDVSFAYDAIFTNQTSSQIESYGPLSIIAGEASESNDLTFRTYNSGDIVLDAGGSTSNTGTISFYDSNIKGATDDTPIPFADSSTDINTFRTNFTGENIIDALNEAYAAAGGGGPWTDGGGYVYTTNGEVLNMGGVTSVLYHAFSDVGTTSHSLTGDDSVYIEGNFEVDTNAFFDGNITLGDAASDTVTVTADVASNLIPSADDTYDLGDSSNRWRDLYLGPQSLHIGTSGNEAIIGYDTTSNWIEFNPSGDGTEEATLSDAGTLTLAGDLGVNGGDLTSSAATFNLLNATPTTINFGGAATAIEIGAATGTTSVNNALTVDGNTTLGNAASDTVTFTADVASNLIPSADDTYTLGDSSNRWADVFIGPKSLHIGVSGNEAIIGYDTTANAIEFDPDGDATDEFTISDAGAVAFDGTLTINGSYSFTSAGVITAATNETINGIDINSGAVTDVTQLTVDNLDLNGNTLRATTGNINFQPDNDTDDYLYVDTTTNVPGLFWEGIAATDPGIYVNGTELGYRDETDGWVSFDSLAGGGGGAFTDSGTTAYLTDTTDEVVIGATSPVSSAKLSIDGDAAAQIQFLIQGATSQSADYFVVENSAGTDQFTINSSGNVTLTGDLAVNGDNITADGDLDIDAAGDDITTPNRLTVGSSTAGAAKLTVTGAEVGKALTILNETGDQNILVASDSGTGRFALAQNSDISILDSVSGINSYGSTESLVANASFEVDLNEDGVPDGWEHDTASHTGTLSSSGERHGDYYYSINSETSTNILLSSCFPVSESQQYNFGAYFKASSATISHGVVRINEYTSRSNCDSNTSPNLNNVTPLSTNTTWTDTNGSHQVGSGYTWARWRIENQNTSGRDLDIDGFRAYSDPLVSGVEGLDLAETYPVNPADNIEPGHIVAFGVDELEQDIPKIRKSSEKYDKNTFGVVATQPGLVLDDSKNYPKAQVALAGRVPVQVTSENGPIRVGDAITASSVPGLGMKSTKPGRVIGRAMTTWDHDDPAEIGVVTVFVEPGYDAGYLLTETQKLIKDSQKVIVSESIKVKKLVAGSISATSATVQNLVAQSIKATTATVQTLAANTVNATNATIDNLIVNRFVGTEATLTDAEIENLNATAAQIQELKAEKIESKSLDTDILTTDSLSAGTITADTIDSQNVRDLRDRLARVAAEQSDVTLNTETLDAELAQIQEYITQLTQEEAPEDLADTQTYQKIQDDIPLDPGTTESVLGTTITTANLETLTVTGTASMTSLTVADAFSAGDVFIKDNNIVSLNNELKLGALERVDIMNGGVVITADGTITAKGEIIAEGGIRSNTLQALNDGDDVAVRLSQTSEQSIDPLNPTGAPRTRTKNSELKIENSTGARVASINAEGSAAFADISLTKYNEATSSAVVIEARDNYRQTGIYAPAIRTASAASGNGILPAGQNDIILFNNKVSETSVINITPTSSTRNNAIYVDRVETCEDSDNELCQPYFRVALDDDIDTDVKFNWLIVN